MRNFQKICAPAFAKAGASSELRTGRIPRAQWPQYLPQQVLQVIETQGLYGAKDPLPESEESCHDL